MYIYIVAPFVRETILYDVGGSTYHCAGKEPHECGMLGRSHKECPEMIHKDPLHMYIYIIIIHIIYHIWIKIHIYSYTNIHIQYICYFWPWSLYFSFIPVWSSTWNSIFQFRVFMFSDDFKVAHSIKAAFTYETKPLPSAQSVESTLVRCWSMKLPKRSGVSSYHHICEWWGFHHKSWWICPVGQQGPTTFWNTFPNLKI